MDRTEHLAGLPGVGLYLVSDAVGHNDREVGLGDGVGLTDLAVTEHDVGVAALDDAHLPVRLPVSASP